MGRPKAAQTPGVLQHPQMKTPRGERIDRRRIKRGLAHHPEISRVRLMAVHPAPFHKG